MVSSSARMCPPRAALMGSTSPIMSAMVTSGVASFSTYRYSLGIHSTGASSPMFLQKSRPCLEMGIEGIVVHLAPGQNGDLRIQKFHELPEDPALRLSPEAQKDEVVPGENRIHQLGNHGVCHIRRCREEVLPAWSFRIRFLRSSSLTGGLVAEALSSPRSRAEKKALELCSGVGVRVIVPCRVASF